MVAGSQAFVDRGVGDLSRSRISIGETSGKIIGVMLRTKGEEFVKKLKDQEIKLYSIDPPALEGTASLGKTSKGHHAQMN